MHQLAFGMVYVIQHYIQVMQILKMFIHIYWAT